MTTKTCTIHFETERKLFSLSLSMLPFLFCHFIQDRFHSMQTDKYKYRYIPTGEGFLALHEEWDLALVLLFPFFTYAQGSLKCYKCSIVLTFMLNCAQYEICQ